MSKKKPNTGAATPRPVAPPPWMPEGVGDNDLALGCAGTREQCLAAAAARGLAPRARHAEYRNDRRAEHVVGLDDGRSYLIRERVWAGGNGYQYDDSGRWRLLIFPPPAPVTGKTNEELRAEGSLPALALASLPRAECVFAFADEAEWFANVMRLTYYTPRRVADGEQGWRIDNEVIVPPEGWWLVEECREGGVRWFRAAFRLYWHAGGYHAKTMHARPGQRLRVVGGWGEMEGGAGI